MERDTTDHPDSIRSSDTATFLYYYLAGFGGSFLVSACAVRSTDLRDWVVTLDAASRILVGNPALGQNWAQVVREPQDPASTAGIDHPSPSKQIVALDVIRKRRGRFIVVGEDGNLEIYAIV